VLCKVQLNNCRGVKLPIFLVPWRHVSGSDLMSCAFSVMSVPGSETSKICSCLSSGVDDPHLLDVTVCCWVKGSHHFKELCFNLNSFETSKTTHPITQHHVPEELDFCGCECHVKRRLGETVLCEGSHTVTW
jgi:hypothetical protein